MKLLKPMSLRMKLIIFSLVFILVPIFTVGVYTYQSFESVLSSHISATAADRLHQVNINIERELRAMMNASSSIVLDDHIRDVLNSPPTTDREVLDSVEQIDRKVLEISTSIITDPVYITVMDNYGHLYTNWFQTPGAIERINGSSLYQNALVQNGYATWELNHANYVDPNQENMVTLAMVIKDRSFTRKVGMLFISEPVSHFADILQAKDLPYRNIGFMMSPKGAMLTGDKQGANEAYPEILPMLQTNRDSFTAEVKGEKVDVVTDYISMADWRVVQIVHQKDVFTQIHQIRNIAVTTLVICLAIFIAIIVFISNMFTSSLRKLQAIMKKVEGGQLDVTVDIRSMDEVGWLGKSFNRMVKRLRHHIDREIELERMKETAKLEALQAQINPHFLHNTLNTIKWMSIMAGTKNITEMLLSFGHLLNMSIHRGQEAITLKEEIDNVRYFLTIQKFRFGDTIQVIEELDEATLDAYVPKLSLQPLVENVYHHGLFIEGGKMTIRTSRMNGDLLIEVIDNGSELTPERLKDLEDHLNGEERKGEFSGIGLKNVHNRIQMMYGRTYGVRIQRDESEGLTSVAILLPDRRDIHEIASSHH